MSRKFIITEAYGSLVTANRREFYLNGDTVEVSPPLTTGNRFPIGDLNRLLAGFKVVSIDPGDNLEDEANVVIDGKEYYSAGAINKLFGLGSVDWFTATEVKRISGFTGELTKGMMRYINDNLMNHPAPARSNPEYLRDLITDLKPRAKFSNKARNK